MALETAPHSQVSSSTACDCCGGLAWEFLFSDNEMDLGRCGQCGLHYVNRLETFQEYEDTGILLDATLQLEDERLRMEEFEDYIDLVRRSVPTGKWMDLGCGTGMLIHLAGKRGVTAEGIELTPSRATLARQLSQATIYETPLEDLKFRDQSFAAVIAINVFSHLRRPSETLAEIRRILAPGGILMLVTGEIGPGLRKEHNFSWPLGEELYYLGDHTIEWYGRKIGFELLLRERKWLPHVLYSKQRFREKGCSSLRNIAKKAFLYTPGALPALRYYIAHVQQHNPIYSSTLLLKRSDMESTGPDANRRSAD